MQELKSLVYRVILFVVGLIIFLLVLRLGAILLGANQTQSLVSSILDLTAGLVMPFQSIGPNIILGGLVFETATIIALLIYIVGGVVVADLVTSFIDDDPLNIVINVFDAIFKILEFLLISRFILKLFAADVNNSFIQGIYQSTDWASGVFPVIGFGAGVIEVSVIVIFIVVVMFDVFLEDAIVTRYLPSHSVRVVKEKTVVQERPANITVNMIPNSQPQTKTVVVSRDEFERMKG